MEFTFDGEGNLISFGDPEKRINENFDSLAFKKFD